MLGTSIGQIIEALQETIINGCCIDEVGEWGMANWGKKVRTGRAVPRPPRRWTLSDAARNGVRALPEHFPRMKM
jgi:hypothetical protein